MFSKLECLQGSGQAPPLAESLTDTCITRHVYRQPDSELTKCESLLLAAG